MSCHASREQTHPPFLGQGLVRRRLEEHDTPRDVDDRRSGHGAERFAEREGLGGKHVAVLVLLACGYNETTEQKQSAD